MILRLLTFAGNEPMDLKRRISTCADFADAVKIDKHAVFLHGCIEVSRNYVDGTISDRERQDAITYALEYLESHREPITELGYSCLIGNDPLQAANFARAGGVSPERIEAILLGKEKTD